MSRKSRKKWKRKSLAGVPTWMVAGNLGKTTQKQHDAYDLKRMGTFGAASSVRKIDPETGQYIEIDALEHEASLIIKSAKKQPRKTKTGAVKGGKRIQKNEDVKNAFYKSWEWRTLRMEVLKEHGRRCQCCGATPDAKTVNGRNVTIVVDHIKPLSRFWHLRLTKSNLQVLCDECNQGKGNWDETDYRPDEFPQDEPMTPVEQQMGERLRVIDVGKAA